MAGRITKINTKLQLYFFTLVLLALAIAGVYTIYNQRIKSYYLLQSQIKELNILNPKILKAEQNFMLHDLQNADFMQIGESANLDEYHKYMLKAQNLLENINRNPLSEKLKVTESLKEIKKLIEEHKEIFNDLVEKCKYRGFKDFGMEGKMRRAIYRLQVIDTLNQAALLRISRFEKDFILRKDIAYVDSLKWAAGKLVEVTRGQVVKDDPIGLANLTRIILLTNQYVKQFERLAQLETEIGLNEKSGLKGRLNQTSVNIEKALLNANRFIEKNTQILDQSATFWIWTFLVIIILIAIVFIVIISYRLSRPIVILDRVAQSVTKGLRNQEVFLDKIKSNDEIGSLAKNFKIMLVKLRQTLNQANEKNRQLEEFTRTEARRAWFNEGLAIFNELLRKHYSDLGKLADEIISELVKYTRSSQGGLFVINREDQGNFFLELKGCYAYERKRFTNKRIEYGEGLIGMAWRDSQKIILKDIPEEYVFIRSGLGRTKPKVLIMIPIKSDEGTEGIIELISMYEYADYEIQFMEALSERIGSSIVNIKANEQTQKLLKISEDIAQEAQAKEARLQKQLAEYQHWIQEFEAKVNSLSEESLIYHAILGKVYSGFVITDQDFRITKINLYAAKRFGFKRNELEGRPLELFMEADYNRIVDLKDKKLRLNNRPSFEPMLSRVRDKQGNLIEVEAVAGKIEIDMQVVYVFLFNELEEKGLARNNEVNLKVAS